MKESEFKENHSESFEQSMLTREQHAGIKVHLLALYPIVLPRFLSYLM